MAAPRAAGRSILVYGTACRRLTASARRAAGWRCLASASSASADVVNAKHLREPTGGGLGAHQAGLERNRPAIVILGSGQRRPCAACGGADKEKPRRHDRAGAEGGAQVLILGMRCPRITGRTTRGAFEAGLRRSGQALPERAGAVLSGDGRLKSPTCSSPTASTYRRGAAADPGTRCDEAAAPAQVTVAGPGRRSGARWCSLQSTAFLKISRT